ncbi:MAG: ATPase [Marinilabiliales bacterium]|nr:MAG: ATPase [Marinilabiliales bacterium]
MENLEIKVRKGNGDLVPFEVEKLKGALTNSGASKHEIEKVINHLKPLLFDGISTKKIYRLAYTFLKKHSSRAAGKYRLKKAIFELGPTGYPFEKFIAKLFESDGYEAVSGVLMKGRCVQHEVDVVAQKGNKKYMVECKFHSDSRAKSDVKVALYIQSRFLDLSSQWAENEKNNMTYRGMIVTNTRFTNDAQTFGECVGLKVVSWDYPPGNSLKNWIDRSGYHPITSLSSLRKNEKQFLLEKGIVLCSQLKDDFKVLNGLSLSSSRKNNIKRETLDLLS